MDAEEATGHDAEGETQPHWNGAWGWDLGQLASS